IVSIWKNEVGINAPWPFNSVKGPPSYRGYLLFINLYPFTIILYSVLVPLLLFSVFLILLPFVLAERLRSKLTPENPIFSDIVAYFFSLMGIMLKITKAIL